MEGAWRALLVAGLAGLVACGPRYEPAPIRSVLLVSIDTLRADHLGVYDPTRPTSPHLDALARNAAVFETAIATNPLTLPSHATLLTGLLPPRHGVRDNDGYRLADDRTTLAEVLKAHGFATGAVVGADILARRYGLAQGFDVYDDDVGPFFDAFHTRPARQVTDPALRFLAEHADDRFFLFVHYYDPHHSYSPPEPYRSRFPDHPYAGEVAYTDAQVGRLLAGLDRHGLLDETLVVVTSDHGEDFGEHDEIGHSYFVYQVTQHVPLIVRAPGMQGQRRLAGAVGIGDVVPTVLGLLGIEPPPDLQGRDLSPLLRGEAPEDRDRRAYAESFTPTKLGANPLLALASERWKLIHTTRPELYDLAADPGETRNLAAAHPERVAALAEQIEAIQAGARPGARLVDPETAGFLNALGYLKGEIEVVEAIDPQRPDPKDVFPVYNRLRDLVTLQEAGRLAEAREVAEAIVRERPDLVDVHKRLGDIAYERARYAEAIGHYERYLGMVREGEGLGLRGDPTARHQFDLYVRLGAARAATGAIEPAVAAFRRAVEVAPDEAAGHANLGRALLAAGRPDEARAPLREALRLDPTHTRAREDLARLEAGAAPGGGG